MTRIENVNELHEQRQFLGGNQGIHQAAIARSYVYVQQWSDDGKLDIEAQFTVADGYHSADFDGTWNERYDDHLQTMTRLRDQLIDYCDAYEKAVAIVRASAPEKEGAE